MVVTDYRMEGMNGLELARLLHQKVPSVPVIIVTGYKPEDDDGEAIAWLEKQDLFPALLDKIKSVLGEGDPEEALKSA
jgi:CheY-like chemotaxis protein